MTVRTRESEIRELAARAKGQTERDFRKEVNNRGFSVRVLRRDGIVLVGTRDYKRDRINVSINNDIVVEANVG